MQIKFPDKINWAETEDDEEEEEVAVGDDETPTSSAFISADE